MYTTRLRILVGNLGDILANSTCPLCRLISFAVSCQKFAALLDDIDCYLKPRRADAAESTAFVSKETQAMTATSLVIHLQVCEGTNPDGLEYFHPVDIKIKYPGPEQISRPLLNGAEAAYAALSYVWGYSQEQYATFRANLLRPGNKAARVSFLIRYQTHQRCHGDLLATGPAIYLV